MKKNVHIVPHVHWDREWYFSAEESKILLVNNVDEILNMLETNEDYPYFVLDGQTSILEDYLQVKPENRLRMKKLAADGKLIIGPWYTQSDEMVVGGESIVRNLFYGLRDCKPFGEAMKIGYLPDSFGQSAGLPQILNGFNITRCMFWRGTSERMGTNKTEFYWEGNGGAQVLTQLLPLGYSIGKYLPIELDQLKDRMDKYFPVLDRGTVTENIILPNGHDQMPIQKNIFEVINSLKTLYPERNFFLSSYENIFDELEKIGNHDLVKGELLDGKYMRVHRSIFSTRADIKSANTRIENKLTNILEPLASIAYSLGFEYYSGHVELIWKEIMKNHAHDSIGCCCSDKVHKEVMYRFFIAEEKTDALIGFYKRKIVDAMENEISLDKLTVFNLLLYERDEIVEAEVITKFKMFDLADINGNKMDFEIIEKEIVDPGLIDRQIVHYGDYEPFIKYRLCFRDTIKSMGYKTYFIKESKETNHLNPGEKSNCLENEYFKIEVNSNGTLTVLDKKSNDLYKDVLLVENAGDDGDEYDFSPLENDSPVYANTAANIKIINYKYKTVANIRYCFKVPKDIESRKNKIIDSEIWFEFEITLKKLSPFINVKVTTDNKAKDHRVRVLIPNLLGSGFSLSDNQFGCIRRPVVDEAMAYWEAENWDERPDAIYPMLNYAAIDNTTGLSVLTNSVREYEIIGEQYNTIAITLFRSIGHLGKENLLRRPGRPSGIKLCTPDSQMIGVNSYEFAIASFNENLSKKAKEYLTPLVSYNKMPYNAMKLNPSDLNTPYEYQFLQENKKEVTLSALKKSEDTNGFILRYYNGMQKNTYADFSMQCKQFKKSNLNEEVQSENDLVPRELPIASSEVQTYYFEI